MRKFFTAIFSALDERIALMSETQRALTASFAQEREMHNLALDTMRRRLRFERSQRMEAEQKLVQIREIFLRLSGQPAELERELFQMFHGVSIEQMQQTLQDIAKLETKHERQ